MGTHTPCRPTGPTKWLHIQHSTQDNCTLWCTWSQINTWSNICWLGLGFWEQNMTTDYSMSIPQTYGTTHCPHTSLHTGHTPAHPLATYQPTHWTHTSPPTGHTPAHPLAIHQSTYWPYTSPPTSPPTGHTHITYNDELNLSTHWPHIPYIYHDGPKPSHALATQPLLMMMDSNRPIHWPHNPYLLMMDSNRPIYWPHTSYIKWWTQTYPSNSHTPHKYYDGLKTYPSISQVPLTYDDEPKPTHPLATHPKHMMMDSELPIY